MRIERIGDATLYLGDALEILPTMDKVDCVVTDPPYGINGTVTGLRASGVSKGAYTNAFIDDRENIKTSIVPAVKQCIQMCKRVALTCGTKNMWLYPEPSHVGTYQYPGSTVMTSWGPMLWQPILYYGKDPYPGKLKPDSMKGCVGSERDIDHPCPKPYKQTEWLVNRATRHGEAVLDPFMGSGTTGVACANLGRKFIGIEIEPKYFDIACERIEAAQAQLRLFA